MKTPKECKTLEELVEVEIAERSKLILDVARFQADISVLQRVLELVASNATEELSEELKAQLTKTEQGGSFLSGYVQSFLAKLKEIMEMRKELTPKYQPIFISGGMPGMMNLPGGLSGPVS